MQPNGVRVRDAADFRVYTEGAGEGITDVKIIGPGGITEPAMSKKIDQYTTEYVYYPKKQGKYTVIITYGDQEIGKSPFSVRETSQKRIFFNFYEIFAFRFKSVHTKRRKSELMDLV